MIFTLGLAIPLSIGAAKPSSTFSVREENIYIYSDAVVVVVFQKGNNSIIYYCTGITVIAACVWVAVHWGSGLDSQCCPLGWNDWIFPIPMPIRILLVSFKRSRDSISVCPKPHREMDCHAIGSHVGIMGQRSIRRRSSPRE
jgi:hypothetical protein